MRSWQPVPQVGDRGEEPKTLYSEVGLLIGCPSRQADTGLLWDSWGFWSWEGNTDLMGIVIGVSRLGSLLLHHELSGQPTEEKPIMSSTVLPSALRRLIFNILSHFYHC